MSNIMLNIKQNYDLAIFQLAVYTLLTPLALFILVTRAIKKPWYALGWFYLLGFLSLLLAASGLIIGAGQQSVSSIGLVLSAVGLSPLFVVVECVLREAVSETPASKNVLFSPVGFVMLHVLIVAAAVLTAVGAKDLLTPGNSATDMQNGSHLVKAGVVVFIVPWLWLVAMVVLSLKEWNRYTSNKKLVIGCLISLPLLAVRIIYGILEFYVTSTKAFNPIEGNIVARLFLSVLPTMIVATTLSVAGALTPTEYHITPEEHELTGAAKHEQK